jgi:hypothetical protein
MNEMNEMLRLELIVEAVRYCQRVKGLGMPPSCYTKALREPVYFLWTRRGGGPKDQLARYRSKSSVRLKRGRGQLLLDHAIPFKHLQSELLELHDVTPEAVRRVLAKEILVLVSKSENHRLNASGLRAKMPPTWDGTDALARYRTVGIELVKNLHAQ